MIVEATVGLINREYIVGNEPNGKKVEVLPPFAGPDDPWIPASVVDSLSTQFTAKVKGHGTQFYFYADRGATWRDVCTKEVHDDND